MIIKEAEAEIEDCSEEVEPLDESSASVVENIIKCIKSQDSQNQK